MTCGSIPVASLSIWKPIHLGTDETGRHVYVNLAERNMLIGGEPGSGKSVALQLIVAHAAMSADVRLILIDGKRVELGLWAACADRFVGPSIDDAIEVMHWLQGLIDERTDLLLQMRKRKVTPDLGWPFYLVQPRHRRPRPRPRHHPGRSHPAALCRHHPHQPARPVRLPVGVPLLHRSILRHHPRTRLGQHGLLGHRDRPPGPRRVLAPRRRRHPPPHESRLLVRRGHHQPRRRRRHRPHQGTAQARERQRDPAAPRR